MWDYSISQETEFFSVYIRAAESFAECLWIHLGANIPAACSLADLYVQSVCPLLIVGNIYSWPAAVGVRALPPPSRRVSIASLNSVQHRAHPTVFNSEHSKSACTVTFVRERRNACSMHQTVSDAKFNLWNQPSINCNMNTIGTQSSTCFGTAWVLSLWDRHFFNSIINGAFPLWWRSRNAETCRRFCVCCVHIAAYASLVW